MVPVSAGWLLPPFLSSPWARRGGCLLDGCPFAWVKLLLAVNWGACTNSGWGVHELLDAWAASRSLLEAPSGSQALGAVDLMRHVNCLGRGWGFKGSGRRSSAVQPAPVRLYVDLARVAQGVIPLPCVVAGTGGHLQVHELHPRGKHRRRQQLHEAAAAADVNTEGSGGESLGHDQHG